MTPLTESDVPLHSVQIMGRPSLRVTPLASQVKAIVQLGLVYIKVCAVGAIHLLEITRFRKYAVVLSGLCGLI
jgi:hypothetical protein